MASIWDTVSKLFGSSQQASTAVDEPIKGNTEGSLQPGVNQYDPNPHFPQRFRRSYIEIMQSTDASESKPALGKPLDTRDIELALSSYVDTIEKQNRRGKLYEDIKLIANYQKLRMLDIEQEWFFKMLYLLFALMTKKEELKASRQVRILPDLLNVDSEIILDDLPELLDVSDNVVQLFKEYKELLVYRDFLIHTKISLNRQLVEENSDFFDGLEIAAEKFDAFASDLSDTIWEILDSVVEELGDQADEDKLDFDTFIEDALDTFEIEEQTPEVVTGDASKSKHDKKLASGSQASSSKWEKHKNTYDTRRPSVIRREAEQQQATIVEGARGENQAEKALKQKLEQKGYNEKQQAAIKKAHKVLAKHRVEAELLKKVKRVPGKDFSNNFKKMLDCQTFMDGLALREDVAQVDKRLAQRRVQLQQELPPPPLLRAKSITEDTMGNVEEFMAEFRDGGIKHPTKIILEDIEVPSGYKEKPPLLRLKTVFNFPTMDPPRYRAQAQQIENEADRDFHAGKARAGVVR